MAVLTLEESRLIAQLYVEGTPSRELANQFGVCQATVLARVRQMGGEIRPARVPWKPQECPRCSEPRKRRSHNRGKTSSWWCPACSAKRKRELSRNRRVKAMSHYGGACQCCGEATNEFLTFDHVDGREAVGHDKSFAGNKLYAWLELHDYPESFRVLCWNCNSGRVLNGGICPHERQT